MGAKIKILPLVEDAVAKVASGFRLKPRRDEERRLEFRNHIDSLFGPASPHFIIVDYDSLLEAVSEIFREERQFLLDNPWVVRKHLSETDHIAAPDAMLERRKLKPTDKIVLYRSETEPPFIRTRQYKKALLFVKLLTLALSPLSTRELESAAGFIAEWVKNPRYIVHLEGLMRWYDNRRRLLDRRTLRSFNEILSPQEKRQMAEQVLRLAAERGADISARNLKQLERLCNISDYQETDLHSLLHRLHCEEEPAKPTAETAEQPKLLDAKRIKLIEQSTRKVQQLLTDVFEQESAGIAPEVTAYKPELPAEEEMPPAAGVLPPLLQSLAKALEEGEDTREVGELAEELGVAPARLGIFIEELNDLAVEEWGDIAVEMEDDNLFVNREALQSVLKV